MTTTEETARTGERADLLEALAKHRGFLRFTTRDLTDEQAARRTTASALTLGGLIKHVAGVEQRWTSFIVDGPAVFAAEGPPDPEAWARQFRMEPGETLSGLLERYDQVARRTAQIVDGLPSLDVSQPLPKAPWFPPDARWTARRVLLHLIAETAQHAGHADIIRESLDGAKTMG